MSSNEEHGYIYGAVRTPIGAFNGCFASVPAPELAAAAIREVFRKSKIPVELIHEVILGNAISAGIGQAPARQAAIQSGLPESIGATTVNKVCGSGLKAVIMADQAVRLREAEFVLAGGMENMTLAPFLLPQFRKGHKLGNAQLVDSMIHDGLWDPHEQSHMGELCERLAKRKCFSRESQDAYAVTSYTRARKAQDEGIFAKEIAAVSVTRYGKTEWVDRDEQPGAENLEQIPFMRPVFDKEGGSITKGNGAKINDGAAALIIGGKSSQFQPLVRIIGYAAHAQSPATFGLAPVEAIRKALRQCGLKIEDIDLFEINEAFAIVSLAINEALGLNPENVNVHGGAIALGHPIGATGARILVTLIHALQERNLKTGLASLCIGGGEAIAMVVERV